MHERYQLDPYDLTLYFMYMYVRVLAKGAILGRDRQQCVYAKS